MNTNCFEAPTKSNIALKSPKLEYSLEVFAQDLTPHIPNPFFSDTSDTILVAITVCKTHMHTHICFLYISQISSHSLSKSVDIDLLLPK